MDILGDLQIRVGKLERTVGDLVFFTAAIEQELCRLKEQLVQVDTLKERVYGQLEGRNVRHTY